MNISLATLGGASELGLLDQHRSSPGYRYGRSVALCSKGRIPPWLASAAPNQRSPRRDSGRRWGLFLNLPGGNL